MRIDAELRSVDCLDCGEPAKYRMVIELTNGSVMVEVCEKDAKRRKMAGYRFRGWVKA